MYSKLLLLFLLVGLGSSLWAQEKISEAEVNLQKLFIEANREKLLEKYDEAIAIYKKIRLADEDNAAVAFELGRLYHAKKEIDPAIKELQLAIQYDPENEWYYRYLSDIYQESNRNKEGAELYKEMVDRWPDQEHFYLKWAFFLVKDRQVNKAIKVYEQLENRIGVNDEIARRKHLLYLGLGDFKKAGRELEQLIDAFPNEVSYRHMLATFYENINDMPAARGVYESILQIDPNDSRASLALSGISGEQQNRSAYIKQLEALFAQEEIDLDEKIKKIIPFITEVAETGDVSLADQVLQLTSILKTTHPAEAKIFAASGDLLMNSGRPQSAIVEYQQAIKEDEGIYAVWAQLMEAQYRLGRTKDLLKTADEATLVFPNRPESYYLMGAAYLLEANTGEAEFALNQVLLMTARKPVLQGEAKSALAYAAQLKGKEDEAKTLLEEALNSAAKSTEVGFWSAQIDFQEKTFKQAQNTLEDILKIDPSHGRYWALLGQIKYEDKKYEEARTSLEKAIAQTSEPAADLVELLGDSLYQLGDTESAWEQWNFARQLGANSENLDKKIADRRLYE